MQTHELLEEFSTTAVPADLFTAADFWKGTASVFGTFGSGYLSCHFRRPANINKPPRLRALMWEVFVGNSVVVVLVFTSHVSVGVRDQGGKTVEWVTPSIPFKTFGADRDAILPELGERILRIIDELRGLITGSLECV